MAFDLVNFIEQISFQLPNTLLLETVLHKKRRYGMTEYNQSWFGRSHSKTSFLTKEKIPWCFAQQKRKFWLW